MPPPLRLLLLPISTRRALIYCDTTFARASANAVTEKPSIPDRIINKANSTWAEWENSTTTWKLKLVQYGNMMFRRIPFEEWGLKSIPPMPKVGTEAALPQASGAKEVAAAMSAKEPRVEVRYPAKYFGLCTPGIDEMLRNIATERQSLHRQRMRYSIIAMPFTIPVAILPVIPNIPFFYLGFRAWSHWKALRGSQHLEHLIATQRIRTVPSASLDNLYTAGLLYPSRADSRKGAPPTDAQTEKVVADLKQKTSGGTNDVLLLHGWNGKLIAESLKLPALEVEVERAVEQVDGALKKAAEAKKEAQASSTNGKKE